MIGNMNYESFQKYETFAWILYQDNSNLKKQLGVFYLSLHPHYEIDYMRFRIFFSLHV
jgi:hypothetical protein